ncbi:hypothetical protein AMTR_s00087p00110860 [Amborella trichopoda]|uniref:Uncharacterized protein n=1 Tax=Amborella trichopoda TaxID=13333 RepID=W1P3T2_AMBTC|nr:hypothetical protein AMTR_s00087p00110860 [Amborella trichopoda]
MLNSSRNVAEVRVLNLIVQVFTAYEVVERVFFKEDLEATSVERYVGPGFWRSPPPSDLRMPGTRLLRCPPPQY